MQKAVPGVSSCFTAGATAAACSSPISGLPSNQTNASGDYATAPRTRVSALRDAGGAAATASRIEPGRLFVTVYKQVASDWCIWI